MKRRHSPLIIIGSGPAGLAAAAAASAHGEAVTLIDDNAGPGGQIWRGGPDQWGDPRAHALWQLLAERPQVKLRANTRLIDAAGPNELLLDTADGPQHWSCERLLLCTGARELLLPFPGWTLPGVTGAGGLQALIKGGMPIAGKHVVIAGSGPLLMAVAKTVLESGGKLTALAEHRSTRELAKFTAGLALRHRGKLRQAADLLAALRGVRFMHGALVTKAVSTSQAGGGRRLDSVIVEQGGRSHEFPCDFLACGYGLVPNLEFARLLGVEVRDGRVVVDASQRTSREDIFAAGEATGIGGVDKALAEGRIAGLAATGQPASSGDLVARASALDFARLLNSSFAADPAWKALCAPDVIVCRCEDVPASALSTHAEWRAAKLITRCGMGPCQGRVCGAACEFLYDWQTSGGRQPVYPASAATLAAAPAVE
jgi:NADPH-dependent 2,4-dienoyl-CoA reductase/sulfur reductase-like enzyme